ncbi:MAG: alpha/beta hydrolase [Ruminococcus sp.]|nr:alpha/beta hydrolase [Ruminococcus sp.]
MPFWIWIIIIFVILLGISPLIVLPYILYRVLLVRGKDKSKWGRECAIPDDEEYKRMFDIGMEWEKQYRNQKTEVDIVSEGYHLYGEYFDFGGKTAVIIVAGRMESLLYSYYFGEPYRKLGFNVLVIDNRSHGLSDGTVHCLGYKEYVDLINWGKLLHDRFHNERIVFHGICIGSSASLFALTSPDCPDYFAGMAAEGMYTTFYDSFKNHMVDMNHAVYPMSPIVMFYVRIFSHADAVGDGPIYRIDRLEKPILFIHSKEDRFSLPKEGEMVYNKCKSKKKLVWFEKGAHSRVRINDTEGYDKAIFDFYRELGF